jgi:hypothetical protein
VGEFSAGGKELSKHFKKGGMMGIFVIKDRRRFPRFNCSHLASYIRFDEEGRQCEEEKVRTLDISPDGLRLQTYSNLSLFNARGKVIRCQPSTDGRFNVGVAFMELDEDNFHVLYDYFQEILGSRE